MARLLAVLGATGNQGYSVASTVLSSASLRAQYSVRALSRDPGGAKMQDLARRGAELGRADMDDPLTLRTALSGAHTLFFLTTTQYGGHTREIETRQAKAVCEAALAAGVQYIIYSSMSHPLRLSQGTITRAEHFDVKADMETYIRSLPVQSAFFAPASFMQNLLGPSMRPVRAPGGEGEDAYVLASIADADTRVPFIDIEESGKWVAAILAQPDEYAGKTFAAASEILSMQQVVEIVGRVTGKQVRYERVADDVFTGLLPAGMREALFDMWVFVREFGYYGPSTEGDVQWAREQAVGELTGLEAFLRRREYALEGGA